MLQSSINSYCKGGKFYQYRKNGKIIYWFDKHTCWSEYKIIFDRAREYWKTTFNLPGMVEWDGKKGTQYFTLMLGYDEKTSHASATVATRNPHGEPVPTILCHFETAFTREVVYADK